jgi:hypothetical protein
MKHIYVILLSTHVCAMLCDMEKCGAPMGRNMSSLSCDNTTSHPVVSQGVCFPLKPLPSYIHPLVQSLQQLSYVIREKQVEVLKATLFDASADRKVFVALGLLEPRALTLIPSTSRRICDSVCHSIQFNSLLFTRRDNSYKAN